MHRMVSDGLNGNSRVKNAQKVREYNPNSTPRIGDGVGDHVGGQTRERGWRSYYIQNRCGRGSEKAP